MQTKSRPIELLSPAKDLNCGIEAINHGADAVYIGAPKFGARSAAGNSLAGLGSQQGGIAGGIGDVQIPDLLVVVQISALDGPSSVRVLLPATLWKIYVSFASMRICMAPASMLRLTRY